MGDVIGSGMGEFFTGGHMGFFKGSLAKSTSCSLVGVSVLVWDKDKSLIGDQHKEATISADGFRRQRRGRQRSSSDRRGPAMDEKLKKKLSALEEAKTRCTKLKQARMRKK